MAHTKSLPRSSARSVHLGPSSSSLDYVKRSVSWLAIQRRDGPVNNYLTAPVVQWKEQASDCETNEGRYSLEARRYEYTEGSETLT
jgi:hypothetical protein